MNLDEITPQLRRYIEAITISTRLVTWVKDKLERMHEIDRNCQKKQLAEFRRKYDNAMAAIQNLVKLYVSVENTDRSSLSEDEFKVQKVSLTK